MGDVTLREREREREREVCSICIGGKQVRTGQAPAHSAKQVTALLSGWVHGKVDGQLQQAQQAQQGEVKVCKVAGIITMSRQRLNQGQGRQNN
jgi:hypothetical protein